MTSKIIAFVAAVVGFSLTSTTAFAAPASSQPAAARYVRAVHSPARAEHPGQPGRTAKRRTAVAPAAAGPAVGGRRAFGPECRKLPRSGPGSVAALATVPLATAISQVPGLSKLARALQLAGLTRMLNRARALTVFAPDNAAFDALGDGNLQALLSTGPDLVKVLKFHLVTGRLTPAELARRHTLTTVAGTRLYLARAGHSFAVSNATVTCGNVQTSNAVVYVVSRVIVPTS
jgi:uncharacterized surface protein with fasciclin (FAS1) repeats